MSLIVGVSVDGSRIPMSRDQVARVARSVLRSERVTNALLSIAFVSNPAIAALNRRHLKRRGATDVIAFGFRPTRPMRGRTAPIVGDVYIAPGVARVSARAHRIGVREELVRLIVHGTLHVMGHDHAEGEARMRSPMWRKQERLVQRLARRRA